MTELALQHVQAGQLASSSNRKEASLFELNHNRLYNSRTGEEVPLEDFDTFAPYISERPYEQIPINSIFSHTMHDREPLLKETQPDIQSIERAVLDKDYDTVYKIADRLTLQHAPQDDPHTWTRAVLHGLSVPLYRRMALPRDRHITDDLSKDIEAIYGVAGHYLDMLLTARRATPRGRTYDELTGDMSELTVFSLSVRGFTGKPVGPAKYNPTDRRLIIPGTIAQDIALQRSNSHRLGYDATLIDLRLQTATPVQVKTAVNKRHGYDPSILVIATRELAGDGYDEVDLTQAIIHEIDGTASDEEITLITEARQRLDEMFKRSETKQRVIRRRQLGTQAFSTVNPAIE